MNIEQCHVNITNNSINAYVLVDDNGFGYKVYYKQFKQLNEVNFEYIKDYGTKITDFELIKSFFDIKEKELIKY